MTRLVYLLTVLSFRAVFITKFCVGRLPQIAANKKIVQFVLISGFSRPSLFCFAFDLNLSQRTKRISRNGYGPDWLPTGQEESLKLQFFAWKAKCPTRFNQDEGYLEYNLIIK